MNIKSTIVIKIIIYLKIELFSLKFQPKANVSMSALEYELYDIEEYEDFEEAEFDQSHYDFFIKSLKVLNQEEDAASNSTQEGTDDQSNVSEEIFQVSVEDYDSSTDNFELFEEVQSVKMLVLSNDPEMISEFYKYRTQMQRKLRRSKDHIGTVKDFIEPCIIQLVGEDYYLPVIG